VDMWTIGSADRLRFPGFPRKLGKREGSTSLCNCVVNLLTTRNCYPFNHQAARHVLAKGMLPLIVKELLH
jgi:hypothetical protein